MNFVGICSRCKAAIRADWIVCRGCSAAINPDSMAAAMKSARQMVQTTPAPTVDEQLDAEADEGKRLVPRASGLDGPYIGSKRVADMINDPSSPALFAESSTRIQSPEREFPYQVGFTADELRLVRAAVRAVCGLPLAMGILRRIAIEALPLAESVCRDCGGTGIDDDFGEGSDCNTCNGTGCAESGPPEPEPIIGRVAGKA